MDITDFFHGLEMINGFEREGREAVPSLFAWVNPKHDYQLRVYKPTEYRVGNPTEYRVSNPTEYRVIINN